MCDYQQAADQDNWLITQYISYLDAQEVFVTVSVNLGQCISSRPSCNRLIVDMLQYETDQADGTQRRRTANYSPLYTIEVQPSENTPVTREFTFINDGNFNGFYLAFRDTEGGTCANLQSLRVYYRICPERVEGLVTYPEIGLPPEGMSEPITRDAICASNSSPTSSLELSAFADGRCEGEPACACDPGYEYDDSVCQRKLCM